MGRRLPWTHPHLKKTAYAVSESTPQHQVHAFQNQNQNQSHRPALNEPTAAAMTLRSGSGRGSRRGGRLVQNRGGSTNPQTPTSSRPTSSRRQSSRYPGTPNTPASSQRQPERLDGLFANGTWHCNCEPRKEAVRFPVKKEGRNKGRLFWTCDTRKCNFFLWDEDAAIRSEGLTASTPQEASASTTTTATTMTMTPTPAPPKNDGREPRMAQEALAPAIAQPTQMPTPSTRDGTSIASLRKKSISDFFPKSPGKLSTAGPDGTALHASSDELPRTTNFNLVDRSSGQTSSSATLDTPSAGPKRKRVQFDEDLIGDLSSDEERQLTNAMERSSRKLQGAGSVPQGSATTGQATTPCPKPATTAASTITVEEDGLPTPPTARTLFPDAKRQRGVDGEGDVNVYDNITNEVMHLLENQPLDAAVSRAVRQALDRHAARNRGAIKGRDAVRSELRAKDERISRLQERVAALENKCKMQKEQITNFKASLADLYARN